MTNTQGWLVKVSENNKHAFNEGFWTRKKALEFINKITNQAPKWSCELVRVGVFAKSSPPLGTPETTREGK